MGQSHRKLERIVKGFSNHRRIQMIELLMKEPDLSILEISESLRINIKTASEHLRRLTIYGLVLKRYSKNNVRHRLTDRTISILNFLKTLD